MRLTLVAAEFWPLPPSPSSSGRVSDRIEGEPNSSSEVVVSVLQCIVVWPTENSETRYARFALVVVLLAIGKVLAVAEFETAAPPVVLVNSGVIVGKLSRATPIVSMYAIHFLTIALNS